MALRESIMGGTGQLQSRNVRALLSDPVYFRIFRCSWGGYDKLVRRQALLPHSFSGSLVP